MFIVRVVYVYRHFIRRTNKGNNTQNGDLMNELCGIGNSTQAILMLYTIYLRVNLHCNSCLGFMLIVFAMFYRNLTRKIVKY